MQKCQNLSVKKERKRSLPSFFSKLYCIVFTTAFIVHFGYTSKHFIFPHLGDLLCSSHFRLLGSRRWHSNAECWLRRLLLGCPSGRESRCIVWLKQKVLVLALLSLLLLFIFLLIHIYLLELWLFADYVGEEEGLWYSGLLNVLANFRIFSLLRLRYDFKLQI